MDAESLLARLDGVRKSGARSWVARCPAHRDRSPSLSVKALPDGRILLHCFAGCETSAVLESLGLTFADLFPEPLGHSLPRSGFTASEAMQALARESGVVALLGSDMAEGKPVSPQDAARLAEAVGRITAALEFVHGR